MIDKKLKYFFIPLEFISGIALGLLILYIHDRIGITGHINDYYLKFFSVIYLGIIFGVVVPGFIYTILIKKPKNVFKGIFFSTIGLISFLLIYAIVDSVGFDLIPYILTAWILPVLLPLIGAVIGFNYRIDR